LTYGIAVGLGISLVLGWISPGYDPSLEVESRGEPDLHDLLIALASGMAAAYAVARPNVASTLAGVAIAAALVPPLAVVGIALTHGRPFLSGAAAVLLVTNIVAIVLGSALVFQLLGLKASAKGEGGKPPPWSRRFLMALLLLTVLLITPLGARMMERARIGQSRPALYPVSQKVREAVREFVDREPRVQIVTMGRSAVEPETGLTILLESRFVLPEEFCATLKSRVSEVLGDSTPVRVVAFLSARQGLPEPEK
jgi:uncharacterized membrane protein